MNILSMIQIIEETMGYKHHELIQKSHKEIEQLYNTAISYAGEVGISEEG